VDTARITHPAPRPNTREHRALELYRTRGHEIREISTDLFEVPSCAGEGRYEVDYESETCSCMDHKYRPDKPCKHLYAVGILYAKTHRRVSIAGDPFTAAPHHDQDHPHVCNGGWITIGQLVADPETGEETEEYALYLCRRCADSR
jgi:hypothetical protein